MSKKSVLFLGGTGFVGKSFAHFLLDRDVEYSVSLASRKPLASLGETFSKNYLKSSIKLVGTTALCSAISGADVIIYGADSTRLSRYSEGDQKLENVFNGLFDYPGIDYSNKRIILLSSGAVYGQSSKKQPISEENFFTPFRNLEKKAYANIKIQQEKTLVDMLFRAKIASLTVLRLFAFSGRWLHDSPHFFLNQLYAAKINQEKLVIKNLRTFRSFMPAEQLSNVIDKAIVDTRSYCCNIGSPIERNIQDIANDYGVECDLSSAANDLDYYIPSIQLAQRLGLL